jgi:hypothetical protein
VYSGGQLIAELTEAQAARDGQEAIAGTRYVAGTDGYAAGGGSVVAQAGDTLLSVSQRVYGTSAYWYLLASANGYQYPEVTLAEGQRLQVPEVAVSRNDAGTFKPYNANEALGPTTPVLPYVPSSDKGCGAVGQLLMVVVAVIVTVYTAGAAASALGVTGTTAAGGAASTFATGAAVLTGNTAGAVLTISSTATISMGTALAASAAIGGAVGSIASQAVGMATGNVQSFSWRGVATSALTAGFGAGLGAAAQSGALGATLQQNGLLRGAATGLGSGIVSGAANGFSWRQVASNVVGSLVGGYVGDKVGGALGQPLFDPLTAGGQFGQQALTSFTGGMVSQAVSSGLMGNSRIDPVNALGDALGSALVGRWSGQHALQAQVAFDREIASRSADFQNYASGRLAYGFRDDVNRRALLDLLDEDFAAIQSGDSNPTWQNDSLDRTGRFLAMTDLTAAEQAQVMRRTEANLLDSLGRVDVGREDRSLLPYDGSRRFRGAPFALEAPESFIPWKVGGALSFVGETVADVGAFIEERPLAKYTLMAADVAAGPALFVAREVINRSVIGDAVRAVETYVADRISGDLQRGGRDVQQAGFGGIGGVLALSAATTGLFGAVKSLGSKLGTLMRRNSGPEIGARDIDLDMQVDASGLGVSGQDRGVHTVLESSSKSPRAQQYEDALVGSTYDVATRRRLTPALRFTNPNARGRPEVRFDGVDPNDPSILIDRKINATTRSKQISDIQRWAEALRQNPGFSVRVEVPSHTAYRNVIRLIAKAEVQNYPISVRIVP